MDFIGDITINLIVIAVCITIDITPIVILTIHIRFFKIHQASPLRRHALGQEPLPFSSLLLTLLRCWRALTIRRRAAAIIDLLNTDSVKLAPPI